MRDGSRFVFVVLILASFMASPRSDAQTRSGSGETGEMQAQIQDLRQQLGSLRQLLRQRDESLDALRNDVAAVGEAVSALKEGVASPVALPFLSGPPPSTDAVGVSRIAVFAPRIAADSPRQRDSVFLRLKRVEGGAMRTVAELELGADQPEIGLPLDQNGALYIVDWQTSEGQTYNLLLRDGSGGPDFPSQPAATVQVKPLQSQGRFIFVGYRVD
jgi:hypothetical protein